MANKQTSIEWLAKELYTEMEMKGSGRVFDEILQEALAKHKTELITFVADWYMQWESGDRKSITELYNETYGQ